MHSARLNDVTRRSQRNHHHSWWRGPRQFPRIRHVLYVGEVRKQTPARALVTILLASERGTPRWGRQRHAVGWGVHAFPSAVLVFFIPLVLLGTPLLVVVCVVWSLQRATMWLWRARARCNARTRPLWSAFSFPCDSLSLPPGWPTAGRVMPWTELCDGSTTALHQLSVEPSSWRCFFATFSFFSRSFLRSARSFLPAALSLFFSSFFLFFSSSCFSSPQPLPLFRPVFGIPFPKTGSAWPEQWV